VPSGANATDTTWPVWPTKPNGGDDHAGAVIHDPDLLPQGVGESQLVTALDTCNNRKPRTGTADCPILRSC
jgi:hypothetical protein